jgi:dolichyl-phosphate-mannose--protein O-mannosyl transferase
LPARSLVFCLAAYWSLLAPWIVTRRDSYLYHYLPSYLIALVLLAGVFGDVVRSRRRAVFLLMGALVLLSVWYSPRWAGLAPWA